jgi:DNA-binding CsgD family transcriptional regulator
MNLTAAAVLDMIEASYEQQQDDEAWLRGIAKAFHASLGDGSGTIAMIPRPTDSPNRFEHAVGVEIGDWWRNQLVTFEETPRAIYDAYSRLACGTLRYWSEVYPAITTIDQPSAEFYARSAQRLHGASNDEVLAAAREGRLPSDAIPPERVGITCFDATGRGVVVVVPLRTLVAVPPAPDQAAIWSRIAAHVAAGYRLRRLERASLDGAEAVLDGGGQLQHARGPAIAAAAREALREAAAARDRARSRRRRSDADTVTSQWRALVAGRWSLVDVFDRDGRRYVIAQPNAPIVAADARLSSREAQVVACAALGHSNKLIAYELGLAPSTVAAHLARAAAKLGAATRADLVRLAAEA